MNAHDEAVSTLAAELATVEDFVRGLSAEDWNRSTLLEPFDARISALDREGARRPHRHLHRFDIGVPGFDPRRSTRSRCVSYFIADRSQVAPVVYDYAKGLASQHTTASLSDKLGETFQATIAGARQQPGETVGSGYFALMRLDEWIPSRTVEAVVHGIDLTDAVGAPTIAKSDGVATTKTILDELLARRTVPGRPADLGDDVAFIRVASGRAKHSDPRFPLVV